MNRVKVCYHPKFGHLTRYRCRCGHCEDRKESGASPPEHGHQVLELEGFEELPYEPIAVVHR